MKKKIFSTLLMGAFFLASMSMFTSCKDYDDEINDLQKQIDNLSATIGKINDAIGKGYYLTDVKPIANGVEIFTSNGGDFKITNGADGKNGDTWTIGNDGYWYQNGNKTENKAIGEKGEKGDTGEKGEKGDTGEKGAQGEPGAKGADGLNGDYYVPNAETGKFDRYTYNTKTKKYEKDATEAEEDKISFLPDGTITAVKTKDYLYLYNVEGAEENPVVIALFTHLKSLVFSPEFYYQGIEAFDFATYNFDSWTVNAVNADGDFGKDAPKKGAAVTYAPDLAATYFLNPANAKMAEDAANYKFIGFNRKYTRAGGDDAINKAFNITSADLKNKGQVTVHATYDGNVIKSIANDNEVTVLALQYTQGDSVITSDFAAIQANAYKGLFLNHLKTVAKDNTGGKNAPAKDEEIHDHLYKSAKEAIDAEPMDSVVWNDEDGIDLRELVNTHRGTEDGKADHAWDESAKDTESDLAKSGFTYKFELVGYFDGQNKTSQSATKAWKSGDQNLTWPEDVASVTFS